MSTTYSVGQMNQLGDALELAGFTTDEVTKLRNFSQLKDLRCVINGHAKIVTVKHVIDMDVTPCIPNGLRIDPKDQPQKQVRGQVEWSPEKFQPYLSKDQTTGKKWIGGHDLRKELEGQLPYNANLLDYLLAHPELIPEELKGKATCFWGTIYRDSLDYLCVRYLYFYDESWISYCYYLDYYFFGSRNPAAVAGK